MNHKYLTSKIFQIGNNISGIEKPENNLVPPTKPEK